MDDLGQPVLRPCRPTSVWGPPTWERIGTRPPNLCRSAGFMSDIAEKVPKWAKFPVLSEFRPRLDPCWFLDVQLNGAADHDAALKSDIAVHDQPVRFAQRRRSVGKPFLEPI